MNDPASTRRFWLLLAAGAGVLLLGLGAALYKFTHGHIVTGMSNQIVWGLPHVFAIFMIVAASGVLNVASVGSVFGQAAYKPRARLSALLCLALLGGGLMVLMLDLGRADRMVYPLTHLNFTSMFTWNVALYLGIAALVAVYLWTSFERRMNPWAKPVGVAVLVWRIVLTSGTGLIFGFLVARHAFQSALLAPLFIAMSLGWGLAVFLLVQAAMYRWNLRTLPADVGRRMARLLAIFVAASLYLVAVLHLTSLYYARQSEFEAFILLGRDGGGVFATLFWLGYVLIGSLLPLVLLFHPRSGERAALAAAGLVIAGAFCWLFVFIVGGQAFPLEIFPGHITTSVIGDGTVAHYVPRWPEWLLGLGGFAAAFVLTLVGVRVLDFMPRDDELPAPARQVAV
jgi:molybdopterin-containing oxidoreductase family membrane subunit